MDEFDIVKDLPLSGLIVLEIGIIVSAPTAGLILADLGAEVIKIENVEGGDPNRENSGAPGTGQFDFLNRNKHSVSLNLKTSIGREIFFKIAEEADIIIENLAPGSVESLGIDFESISKINPRIIYCSIKGFGNGPYSKRKMTDYPAQSESGLAYMTGLKDRPMRAGASVLDMMAANMVVISILAAIYRNVSRGIRKAEKVTVGMFETGAFLVAPVISRFYQNHEIPMPLNEVSFRWSVYDFFSLSDGRKIFLGIINERQWAKFVETHNIPELRKAEFSTNDARLEHRSELLSILQKFILTKDPDEFVRDMSQSDLLFAFLNRPDQLIDHEHLSPKMLEYRSCVNDAMKIKLPALPIESSNYTYSIRQNAPKLGEWTYEILRQLGYSGEQISELKEKGIINF